MKKKVIPSPLVFGIALFTFIGATPLSHAQIKKKKTLAEAQIDGIELSETPLQDSLEFLQIKAAAANAHPANFILYDPNGTLADRDPTVTLKLTAVPLANVLKYVCDFSETSWIVDSNAIVIGNKTDLEQLRKNRQTMPTTIARNAQMLKLAKIPVTDLEFGNIQLGEAIDYFRLKANEDQKNPKTAGVPVNFGSKKTSTPPSPAGLSP